MAAAPAAIGIAARIGGLAEFIGGIGQINAQMLGLGNRAQTVADGLNIATTGFQEFNNQVGRIQTTLSAVGQAFDTITSPIRAVGSALGEVVQTAGAASSEIVSHLGEIATAATGLGTAGGLGIAAFGTALAGGVGAAIGVAARFQQEVADFAAITQSVPDVVDRVSQSVLELSGQFRASIPDIQRSALELVKAGVSSDQVAGGVLRVALSLQQLSKGELDARKAGEGLGALLQLFDKQFQDSGQSVEDFALRLGNNVTAVANNTRASITEVLNAVNILAPTLAARGQQVEDIFAALNVTLQAGLRGGEAGTGIRNLFNFLIGASKEAQKTLSGIKGLEEISPFDVNGNLRPALDVIRSIQTTFSQENLQAKGINQAQAEQALTSIFQTRAATAANIIRLLGDESIQKFFGALGNTNLIQQAQEQLKGLVSQLDLLKNAAEQAAISFGTPFLGGLSKLTTQITAQLRDPKVTQSFADAGQGIASILTGQNEGQAGQGIAASFGTDLAKTFSVAFNEAQALRGPVSQLLDDLGRLKDTIGGIVFPDSGVSQVQAFAKAIQEGLVQGDRFVNFLNANLPATAQSLGQLKDEAGLFVTKLVDIVTQGQGLNILPAVWQSLQPLIATVRSSLDDVATSAAVFIRSIVENRDQIIGFLNIMIIGFTKINQLVIGMGTAITSAIGLVGRLAGSISNISVPAQVAALIALQAGQPGIALNLIQATQGSNVSGVQATTTPTAPKTTGSPTSDELTFLRGERDRTTQAGGGALTAGAAQAETGAGTPRPLPPVTGLGGFFGSGIAGAVGGGGVNGTTGAINTRVTDLLNANQQAIKGVSGITDRIQELQEDAAKNTAAAVRELDKTLSGIRQRLADQLDGIQEQFDDSFKEIVKSAQRSREELQESFEINQNEQAFRDSLSINQQFRRKEFDRGQQDAQRERQQRREDDDVILQQAEEDQLKRFKEGEDALTRERQRGIEDRNKIFQRGQEADLREFSHAQEDMLKVLQRAQEDQNRARTRQLDNTDVTRLRSRDDKERAEDLALELSKATTAADRQRIQRQADDQNRLLKRTRADQDEDRKLSQQREDSLNKERRGQEDTLQKFRRGQEQDLIEFRQQQEDALQTRKRNQELDDVLFRIAMEIRFTQAQRFIQESERQRRRILDAQELIQRRREEDEATSFGLDQQREQREQDRKFAEAGLARAQQKIDETEATNIGKLIDSTLRQGDRARRSAIREATGAQETFENRITNIRENQIDKEGDLLRQRNNLLRTLNETDKSGNSKETADARAALAAVDQQIAAAHAVTAAQGITANSAIDARISTLRDEINGLQTLGAGSLEPLTRETEKLQTILDNLQTTQAQSGGIITVTTVINSPQAERLAVAMENLTQQIQKVAPGTQIGDVTISVDSPASAGAALDSLATVGGD